MVGAPVSFKLFLHGDKFGVWNSLEIWRGRRSLCVWTLRPDRDQSEYFPSPGADQGGGRGLISENRTQLEIRVYFDQTPSTGGQWQLCHNLFSYKVGGMKVAKNLSNEPANKEDRDRAIIIKTCDCYCVTNIDFRVFELCGFIWKSKQRTALT